MSFEPCTVHKQIYIESRQALLKQMMRGRGFSSDAVIEGIKFVNPFSDGSQLEKWIA